LNISASIVEDDTRVRGVLADWIRQAEGFSLVSDYCNAELALVGLPKDRPDVVLVDINLPGKSGVECVRQLKPILPDTQLVMLTVYEDTDHIFDALTGGATGYLLKQTKRHELLNALKEVYAGGSPMTTSIARKVVQSFHSVHPGTDVLSPRQREILDLLARGYINKEVAEAMKISSATVNNYIRRIYEKLHARSRSQAVAKYLGVQREPD